MSVMRAQLQALLEAKEDDHLLSRPLGIPTALEAPMACEVARILLPTVISSHDVKAGQKGGGYL